MNPQATGIASRYLARTLQLLAALLLVGLSVPVAEAAVYGLLDRLGVGALAAESLVVRLVPAAAVLVLAVAVPLCLFASVRFWRATA